MENKFKVGNIVELNPNKFCKTKRKRDNRKNRR